MALLCIETDVGWLKTRASFAGKKSYELSPELILTVYNTI
jgi:hypothetical protein